ncbi:12541_t:CDS:2, partial [Funneliformis geosporum]
YWNRDSDFWGDVQNWNVFYITKVPDCTPQSSHSALTSELEILLNRLPSNSKKYKTANFIRKSIQIFCGYLVERRVSCRELWIPFMTRICHNVGRAQLHP